MIKKFLKFLFVFGVIFIGANVEAATCDFARDLKEKDKGEDVKCLQQYLNNAGFKIADNGAGSKGKETTFFGEKTRDAVMLWQINNDVYPAEGYFGAKSRNKYNSLIKNVTPPTSTTPTVSNPTNDSSSATQASIIASLNSQISTLKQELVNAKNGNGYSGDQKKAADKIKRAIEMIDNALDAIDDSSGSTKNEESDIDEAKSDLFDAVNYFFKNNYTKALDLAEDAYSTSEDVYDNLGGGDKSEAKEAIDELKVAINDAKDEIKEAEDDDEDVDEANDLIDEANDLYKEARTAYNDEDYEEVMDLVEEAMDLVEEAIDSL